MDIQTLKEQIDKLDPQAHKALRDVLTAEYNRLAGEKGQVKSEAQVPTQEVGVSSSPTPRRAVPLSDYRAIYQRVASDPLFDDFYLVDAWLAEHHPALWRKIRELDDELTRLAHEGAAEAVYRGKLEELVDLCRRAQSLREGTWRAMLVKAAVLGEEVWVVKDEEAAQAVMGDGRAIYFTEEILQLKGKTPEQIKAIHTAKRAFPGSRLIQ
jgi:hypothetical protein